MRKGIFTVIKGVILGSGITIVLLIVGIISYHFYELYGDDVGHFIHDYSTTAFKDLPLSNSCKRTGGDWENVTYGGSCKSNVPPKTKQERINREKSQANENCAARLVDTIACVCKSGYYYGSDEEGCISTSQRYVISNDVIE